MAKNILDEIKNAIQEQRKRTMLLEGPDTTPGEPTKIVRQQPRVNRDPPNPQQVQQNVPPQQTQQKDIRGGFNLYHGLVVNLFSQAQSMTAEGGDMVKKLTAYAMQEIGQDEQTAGVFQSSQTIEPKIMATIVQKAVLVALNQVAKTAAEKANDLEAFGKSQAE